MKELQWILATMAAATLVFTGCKKAEDTTSETTQINGVTVDLPKLHFSLGSSTNPEIQKMALEVERTCRYRQYVECLMTLDQLSTNQDLTEPQKKLVGVVTEQMKKVITAAGGAAPQTQ
jgi:hypothetical protein